MSTCHSLHHLPPPIPSPPCRSNHLRHRLDRRHCCPPVPRIGCGYPRYCRFPCTYDDVLLFPYSFPRRFTFPSGRQDRHHFHRYRPMEEGSGFLSLLGQSMEGWRLVCYCILWHVPSKIKKGSEFRVSVRIHSVIGCTGSCGNTLRKKLFLNEIMVTMTSQFWTHHGTYISQHMFFFDNNAHYWWWCHQNLP